MLRRRIFLPTATAAVWAVAWLSAATDAQSPISEDRFEVSVVNVNTSGEERVAGGFQPGGRYSVTNYPLRALIAAAYLRPQVNPDFLIAGGPDWIDKARFNVEAKAAGEFPPGPDGPNAPRRVMLQRLLGDRFGLRVHRENREARIFALQRVRDDRLGPNLKPSQLECGGRGATAAAACAPRIAPGSLTLPATSLSTLVNLLPRFVNRVVIDATGLTGRFDLDLTWTPGPTEWIPPPSAGASGRDDGSSLSTALREQLGLHLQPQTGAVDVLVIDAASWPTGN